MGKGNDDFSFDDDLFGDDDDNYDDFGSDDAGGDDFSFDDDDFDSDLDVDDDSDFDTFEDVDEDFLIDEDSDSGGGGTNRTFIILAGMMIILFIIGLGAVIYLATRETGPSAFDLQVTERVAFNNTQAAFLNATETQSVVDREASATQLVVDQQSTATAEFQQTQAAVEQATIDAQSTLDAEIEMTNAALAQQAQLTEQAQQTQSAILELTNQAGGTEIPTDDGSNETPVPVTQAGIGDVAQTATAIAQLLRTPVVQVTPTFGTGGGTNSGQTPPGQLPNTGLFDDATGGQSMGMVALAAFALVGVIFGARRLRTMNNKAQA